MGMRGREANRCGAGVGCECGESCPAVVFVVPRALPVSFAVNLLVVRSESVAVKEKLTGSTLRDDEPELNGV